MRKPALTLEPKLISIKSIIYLFCISMGNRVSDVIEFREAIEKVSLKKLEMEIPAF